MGQARHLRRAIMASRPARGGRRRCCPVLLFRSTHPGSAASVQGGPRQCLTPAASQPGVGADLRPAAVARGQPNPSGLFSSVLTAVPAYFVWRTWTGDELALLALVGILGAVGQFCQVSAYA